MLQNEMDLDSDSEEIIKKRLQEITGGNLKWGLSAAGFLDPVLFFYFCLLRVTSIKPFLCIGTKLVAQIHGTVLLHWILLR